MFFLKKTILKQKKNTKKYPYRSANFPLFFPQSFYARKKKEITFVSLSVFSLFLFSSFYFFSWDEKKKFSEFSFSTLENQEIKTDHISSFRLPFVKNEGQKPNEVAYYTSVFSGSMFLTNDSLTYVLEKTVSNKDQVEQNEEHKDILVTDAQNEETLIDSLKSEDNSTDFEVLEKKMQRAVEEGDVRSPPTAVSHYAFREKFLDEKGNPLTFSSQGVNESPTKVSFFKGGSETWKSNLPAFQAVSLGEIYNRIDVKLQAYLNNIEKLFLFFPEEIFRI